MTSPCIAVQYLESTPKDATPASVRQRLREAFERLPISLVLLGWDLPLRLQEAIGEETSRQDARLFRWQPLLTGDAQTDLPPEWQTIGMNGDPVSGHGDLPEFTFICPNRSAVADFLAERVESVIASGLYQGLFLDRMRFPSPATNPSRYLACFCKHCFRLAADAGLDLESVRQSIPALLAEAGGVPRFLKSLFFAHPLSQNSPLDAFLNFRSRSLTRTIQAVAKQIHAAGLEVGLDCFSPSLTRMVGQDLTMLDHTCEWIKIMAYPRVFGPAGISFELLGLLDWLSSLPGWNEVEALKWLAETSGLPIQGTRAELASTGLASESVAQEIQRGYASGVSNLLAGIALVEMKGIHESTPAQIRADLEACRAANGLVLSWDLWHIPLEHLDTIHTMWS